ncbi:MAG: hypothetical protein ACR5K2_00415 [Wolbachia sp.]
MRNTNILFVTATPIPRSLKQAMYGDVKCSRFKRKPKSRLPVITVTMNTKRVPDIIEKFNDTTNSGEKDIGFSVYRRKQKLNVAVAEMYF